MGARVVYPGVITQLLTKKIQSCSWFVNRCMQKQCHPRYCSYVTVYGAVLSVSGYWLIACPSYSILKSYTVDILQDKWTDQCMHPTEIWLKWRMTHRNIQLHCLKIINGRRKVNKLAKERWVLYNQRKYPASSLSWN